MEIIADPVGKVRAEGFFAEILMAGAIQLILPKIESFQIGIFAFFRPGILTGGDGLAGGGFHGSDHFQKFSGLGSDLFSEFLHNGRTGLPDEKAIVHALGVDLEKQAGIFCPPLDILPDADPKAFFVGQRMVESGIPVDAAYL